VFLCVLLPETKLTAGNPPISGNISITTSFISNSIHQEESNEEGNPSNAPAFGPHSDDDGLDNDNDFDAEDMDEAEDVEEGVEEAEDIQDTPLFSAEDFEDLREVDEDGTDFEKPKFSAMFRDWVIRKNIPKSSAMEFIRDLKSERDLVFDLVEMNTTWEALAKFSKKEREAMSQVQSVPVVVPFKIGQYVHLGLATMLGTFLDRIVDRTFRGLPKPSSKPHIQLEMWTDGVDLARTGRMRHCWPIAVSVVAVGDNYEGNHVLVPPEMSKPIMVGFYLGSTGKPENGNVLLRQTVDELKVLDPRCRPARDRPGVTPTTAAAHFAKFTASLVRFVADTPARSLAKNVFGHTSSYFCEKCCVMGRKYKGIGIASFQVQDLPLRKDSEFETYTTHLREVSFCNSHRNCFMCVLNIGCNC
jgi:hypothetical protein